MQNYNTSTTTRWNAWDFSDPTFGGNDLTGYEIEAIDGSIGKVDESTLEAGTSFLIVDTGPWIFGRKVMLPAGVVSHVDHDSRRVLVNRTKDQIKNSPEFDESRRSDLGYRDELGTYYGEGGRGWYDTNMRSDV